MLNEKDPRQLLTDVLFDIIDPTTRKKLSRSAATPAKFFCAHTRYERVFCTVRPGADRMRILIPIGMFIFGGADSADIEQR